MAPHIILQKRVKLAARYKSDIPSYRSGFIIDPTMHFETNEEQLAEVDKEKKNIYNPTIPYYLQNYQLKELEVIRLLAGARGTATLFMKDVFKRLGIPTSIIPIVTLAALKGSIATLPRSEEKRIEAFEMWIWRRMERVKWTDRIRNEAVLERVGEERMMLKLIRKRKRNWLGHWLRRKYLLKDALEGIVNGRRVWGRRRYQMIDNIKIYGSYEEIKRKAENRKDWRKLGLQ
ncbi:hypothetical protein ANN_24219 [Periplaneta americana]|uniref:Uncharacterized protein n=1 Tax=Periplaneta americana TaxID=6978 RepID=A0ABQ8S2G8_PERAM|nr:hypothetical protein ANN_24219 [Periplaneta americana]